MPSYVVTDRQTGRKLKLTGDSPPSPGELESIFAKLPPKEPPPAAPAPPTVVEEPPLPRGGLVGTRPRNLTLQPPEPPRLETPSQGPFSGVLFGMPGVPARTDDLESPRLQSAAGSVISSAAGMTESAAKFAGRTQAPFAVPGTAMPAGDPAQIEAGNKALREAPQSEINALPGVSHAIAAAEAARSIVPEDPRYKGEFWAGDAPRAVGSMLGLLPYGPGMLLTAFGAEAQDAFEREIARQQKDKEPANGDKALFKAAVYGTGASAIEYGLGAGYILRKVAQKFGRSGIEQVADAARKSGWAKAADVLKGGGKAALAGAVEEASQESLEGLIVEGRVNPQAVARSAAAGAVGEGVMGAGVASLPQAAPSGRAEVPLRPDIGAEQQLSPTVGRQGYSEPIGPPAPAVGRQGYPEPIGPAYPRETGDMFGPEVPRELVFRPGDPASFLWAGKRQNGVFMGTNPQGQAVMRVTEGGSTLTARLEDLREPMESGPPERQRAPSPREEPAPETTAKPPPRAPVGSPEYISPQELVERYAQLQGKSETVEKLQAEEAEYKAKQGSKGAGEKPARAPRPIHGKRELSGRAVAAQMAKIEEAYNRSVAGEGVETNPLRDIIQDLPIAEKKQARVALAIIDHNNMRLADVEARSKRLSQPDDRPLEMQHPPGETLGEGWTVGKPETVRKSRKVAAEKPTPAPVEDVIIARGEPVERPDVDNGTAWDEWRIRPGTPEERVRGVEAKRPQDWIVERRVVRSEVGKPTTLGDWIYAGAGQSKGRALVEAGKDSRFSQAKPLAPETWEFQAFRSAVQDANRSVLNAQKELQAAENAMVELSDRGTKAYHQALKRAKLFDQAQRSEAPKRAVEEIKVNVRSKFQKEVNALRKQYDEAKVAQANAIEYQKVITDKIAKWEPSVKSKRRPATPAPSNPPAPAPPSGIVGMGGAIPEEFARSAGTPTSIKNATVEAERARRGLPPAIQPARREFGTVWDEAMALIDRDPAAQDALIAELKQRPRALTDLEDALLLHRQIDLQNEYAKATRDMAQAYDDGRTHDVVDGKVRVQIISDQLFALYEIDKAAGTATGRGLAARRMMANEDFTLARMEMEKRVAKGGEPLTEAERARLAQMSERIATLEKQLAEHEARLEQERAQRAASDALNAMVQQAQAKPEFPAHVRSIADRIVEKLETEAVAARARLKAKFARTSAGIDPTILSDVTVILAAKVSRGVLDFSRAANEAIQEFGEVIQPYLEQAWAAANQRIDRIVSQESPAKDVLNVRKRVRKEDTEGRRTQILEGIQQAVQEARPPEELGRYVHELALNYVRAGITNLNDLVAAIWADLQAAGMEITRREAMDAMSGYGRYRQLDPDAIKATLRDLKGQAQQVAKLEDIEARRPMLKTGVERRTPSATERRLIAQVNEAKRRYGVVTDDPARQLKSALDTIKTRLQHQIADLEFQIRTRSKILKTKTQTAYDAEATALAAQRDQLRAQFDAIFPRQGITDEQRIAAATRALESSIQVLEARIAARDISPMRRGSLTPSTPALEALRARRDSLREEMKALRDAAKPQRTPDEIALAALKQRLTHQIADYTERLATGNFAPKPRRQPRLDTEGLRLKAEAEAIKNKYRQELARDEYRRRSKARRAFDNIKEALNLPRACITAWDLSAVLRQGGLIAFGHPVRAAKAIVPMLQALRSEKKALEVEAEIDSRPNRPRMRQANLYIAPINDPRLTAQEEMLMSHLARLIPGVRASQNAFVTFLNILRADSFDAMVASRERWGMAPTVEELKVLANFINIATGRGNIGAAAGAAETLATVIFSPRLVASRVQYLLAEPLYRGTALTRTLIAGEYARTLLGLSVITGLGILAGADWEDDPRSSDFGKLRFGDTRIDPWAGLAQVTVLLSRLITGEKMTAKSEVRPIRGDNVPYGGQRAADVLAQFVRSKLNPTVGAGVDLASGRNVVGEPVTLGKVDTDAMEPGLKRSTLETAQGVGIPGGAVQTAVGFVMPLSYRDMLEVFEAHGVPAGVAIELLNIFGMSVQHYEQRR